jgi:hypothetical protein
VNKFAVSFVRSVRALFDCIFVRKNTSSDSVDAHTHVAAYSRSEFAKTGIPADSLVGPSAGVPMYPKKIGADAQCTQSTRGYTVPGHGSPIMTVT